MKQRRWLETIAVAGACAGLLAACGGKQSPVQPKDLKLEEAACTAETLKGDNEPFIVTWESSAREDLELAMGNGVVLVNYTCDGIKVVDTCSVDGDYAYQGLQLRTKTVQIEDQATASANFGGVGLPGTLAAAMGQGRALNLSTVILGARSTSVPSITRDMLQGEGCEGVTHFVRTAKMGAFAMDTSARGEVKAAGELFGYGSASGEASSSKSTATIEGDLQACEENKDQKDAPVNNCAVPLKVKLRAIAPPRTADTKINTGGKGTIDVRGCPDGFVYVDDICQRPSKDAVPLCDLGDVEGCKANCSKGSSASCGRLANALLQANFDDFVAQVDDKATVKAATAGLEAKLKAACDEDLEGDACTLYAYTLVLATETAKPSGPESDDSTRGSLPEFVNYVELGCMLAEPIGCAAVYTIYIDGFYKDEGWGDMAIDKDVDKAIGMMEAACSLGSARTCMYLSDHYDGNYNDPSTFLKIVPYLKRACDGLQPRACYQLGILHLDQATCATVAYKHSGGYIGKDPLVSDLSYEVDEDDAEDVRDGKAFYKDHVCAPAASLNDKARAMSYFQKACDWDFDLESTNAPCKIVEELKAK